MLVIVMIQCTKRNIECISTGSKTSITYLMVMAETQAITQFYCPVGSGKTVTVYVRVAKTKSRL